MATIVNKTIWTNADWTPIVRKARMMAIPKEWDRATEVLKGEVYNPKIAWSRDFEVARRMAVAEWAKPDSFWKQWGYDYRYVQWQNADNIDTYKVQADKFKPVGYQNNWNKVYKNSKGQQFSLDSNGDAYIVKEKPVAKVSVNDIIWSSTSLTDLQTKMADNPQMVKPFIDSFIKWTGWINQVYQSKYPSYQELTSPMFDNANIAPASNWFTDFTAWVLDTVTALPTVAWKLVWRWVWAVAKMNPYADDATVDKYVKSRESELDKNRSNYMWEQRWWAFTAWQVTAWVVPLVAWWMWSMQIIPKVSNALPFSAPNIPYTLQSLPSPLSFAKLIRWY